MSPVPVLLFTSDPFPIPPMFLFLISIVIPTSYLSSNPISFILFLSTPELLFHLMTQLDLDRTFYHTPALVLDEKPPFASKTNISMPTTNIFALGLLHNQIQV